MAFIQLNDALNVKATDAQSVGRGHVCCVSLQFFINGAREVPLDEKSDLWQVLAPADGAGTNRSTEFWQKILAGGDVRFRNAIIKHGQLCCGPHHADCLDLACHFLKGKSVLEITVDTGNFNLAELYNFMMTVKTGIDAHLFAGPGGSCWGIVVLQDEHVTPE